MPSINNHNLPTVSVDMSEEEVETLAAKLAAMSMPVEAMIEVAIYCKRQREKADALLEIESVMRGRIAEAYDKRKPEDRETVRTEVGLVTYTDAGEKIELKDRDWTVEHLSAEQLRITYKPDIKAMQTIMKSDEFERHIKRSPTPSKITVRDNPKSEDWQELDF